VEGRDELRRICSISECYPQEVCTERTASKAHPLDITLVLKRVLIMDGFSFALARANGWWEVVLDVCSLSWNSDGGSGEVYDIRLCQF
jgi:hypothetical protein